MDPSTVSPSPLQILLVEDSPTLRHAMCGFIRSAGHQPLVAHSGEEALQVIEHTKVDMVIMDVEMPGLNGFETTRLMREWLQDHWIPIIFVTSKTEDSSVEEAIEAGGDDYLLKPVSAIVLRAKIRAMERIASMRNQLRQANAKLQRLSQRDSLTGLYNRRTFNELASNQWALSQRQRSSLSLIMLDIDHFKQYNDHYGHPRGDACLQQVAEAMQGVLQRPTDLLARYGGEEFIALLPDTDISGARKVGENLRNAINSLNLPHALSPTASHLTVSMGIACGDYAANISLESLISLADQLLYHAKSSGRNRICAESACITKTLLLADSDPQALDQLSLMLRHQGNIVTADSGEECQQLVSQLQPNLLLLDIDLDNPHGLELCYQLRQTSANANLAIVLMADETNQDAATFAKQAGANAVLYKPFDIRTLLTALQPYLQ